MTTNIVTFRGIDHFNRPIFKSINNKNHYGSTEILFSYDATEKEVLEKITADDLCFFGSYFGCEPMGTSADVNILLNNAADIFHTAQRVIKKRKQRGTTIGEIVLYIHHLINDIYKNNLILCKALLDLSEKECEKC